MYKSSPAGNCVQLVCYGVDQKWFSDNDRLNSLIRKALLEERYEIEGEKIKEFKASPHPGYTGVFIISESDLTYHTYAEHGSIEFTINTCRSRDAGWVTMARIAETICSEKVYVHSSSVPISLETTHKALGSTLSMHTSTKKFLAFISSKKEFCLKDISINRSADTHKHSHPRIPA